MRRTRFGLAIVMACGLVGLLSDAVSAQARVPDTGMGAVGAEVGMFVPEDIFETDLTVAGSLDYYLSPRLGVRGMVGWTDPNFEDSGDSLRQIRLLMNLLYNWEGGKIHPFVGAGFGAYFLQHKFGGRSVGTDETKAGVNVAGGFEYFTSLTVTIKGEARYHFISQGDLPWSPSGLDLTIGLKKYF